MEEQIYEAELVDEAAVSGSGATRSLNTALGATIAVGRPDAGIATVLQEHLDHRDRATFPARGQ